MRGLTVFIVTVILLIYIIIGGVVFHYMESEAEEDTRLSLLNAQDLLFRNNTCVTEKELRVFITVLKKAYNAGITLSQNDTSPSNWDLYSSVFFATTVVTTIGYGNISPTTSGGRIFCVCFACIGVPLFLVAAGLLAEKTKLLVQSLQERGRKCNPGKIWNRTMKILALSFASCLFVFLPSLIFHLVETDWSYSTSLYYSFITLTTIGFGDYVAGTGTDSEGRGWYRLFVAFWILMGLTWMGTIIAISQEAITKYFQRREDKSIEKGLEKQKKPLSGLSVENNISTQAQKAVPSYLRLTTFMLFFMKNPHRPIHAGHVVSSVVF